MNMQSASLRMVIIRPVICADQCLFLPGQKEKQSFLSSFCPWARHPDCAIVEQLFFDGDVNAQREALDRFCRMCVHERKGLVGPWAGIEDDEFGLDVYFAA